jgi:hypothetical protein
MPKTVTKKTKRAQAPKRIGRARRVPDIKPGRYRDGMPYNEVQYLEAKLILRPNHFTSRKSLFDFAKVMRRPADAAEVDFNPDGFADEPLQIREVLFMDTPDFRLYNNAFILRRRIPYFEGFPIGDPEVGFKFRHPEDLNEQAMQRAEAFFLALQNEAKDWISLGATKTGVVYRLKGNPPHAHE